MPVCSRRVQLLELSLLLMVMEACRTMVRETQRRPLHYWKVRLLVRHVSCSERPACSGHMTSLRGFRALQPFNTWWRNWLNEKGICPTSGEISSWWQQHAGRIWGQDSPAEHEMKLHAKRLRSCGGSLLRAYSCCIAPDVGMIHSVSPMLVVFTVAVL